MDTPIADFVKNYSDSQTVRFHMPGHKGQGMLGIESLDITEIKGADALYEASGIIEKSESNATALFGTQKTIYSTEGSSQCIRAMLYLAIREKVSTNGTTNGEKYPQGNPSHSGGERPVILAGRNVHKSFLYAGAMLDIQVEWIHSATADSICSCVVSPEVLEKKLASMQTGPAAVYITSPDYLGGMSDIKTLADICHKYGTILLVDNAHGAYTKFLQPSLHPMDLGADICCDSAHKTLPVLTGGAYLHIGKNAPAEFARYSKQAMALFGSTSPSYLILQSLDLCNKYIADGYSERLKNFTKDMDSLKKRLIHKGWKVVDSDPLKIVLRCNGETVVDRLRTSNIECEYADRDYVVLMLTPENVAAELALLEETLGTNTEEDVVNRLPMVQLQQEKSLRDAFFAPHETIDVKDAVGRICGTPLVACPPAVPIVITGERITQETLPLFEIYGISQVDVIKE